MLSPPEWQLDSESSEALLRLSGNWLVRNGATAAANDIQSVVSRMVHCRSLRFDITSIGHWDTSLVAFIWLFLGSIDHSGHRIDTDLSALPVPLRRMLTLAQGDHPGNRPQASVPTALPLGVWLSGWRHLLVASAELVGMSVQSIIPAFRGRIAVRAVDIIALMRECGPGALGIITIVNVLTGGILAFVGAVQLRRFGAGIFVSDLLGIAIIREMAPLMTAIVMAGRTGGAYAAHIATMEGNEEIDALRVLGISPFQYLVFPRIIALVAMMPLLYFYACLVGLAGGLAVSLAVLDMPSAMLLRELRSAVDSVQFQIGLTKCICFGAFLALASCHVGLSAGRSAAEVGRAATGAVVVGIIGVIALDAVFAACSNVLGI
jgi:phospholipid/cholesterol/gamma-HCH transport system permease protein